MRVVLQRVSSASVIVNDQTVSAIGKGLLILLGIEHEDQSEDAEWLAQKIAGMRIFSDAENKMNLDIIEVAGEIIVVSQFTLHAATKKGNRPSFIRAARPEMAIPLYEYFMQQLSKQIERPVQAGVFGAMMQVCLVNDGPVTILMDSKNRE
ncbi:MAG: D-tyrosyl-tRNA(Tyr) deacylase [Flavobacteriales bacterium]|nr:D-tyrosyl-tRNA(Tyr) deacylase [Flavobacteriales bacterium]